MNPLGGVLMECKASKCIRDWWTDLVPFSGICSISCVPVSREREKIWTRRAEHCVQGPIAILAILVLMWAASGPTLAQSDPRIGTWKLNAAKSKWDPGPPVKTQTRTYVAVGHALKVSVERVTVDGNLQAYTYTADFDGKDHPVTGQGPSGGDSVTLKRIDTYTFESIFKKTGKVVELSTNVISQDGKSMTITSKGMGPRGQPTNNFTVFDKQ